MTITSNLGVTLLEAAQAQKEVTINEAFVRMDVVIPHVVLTQGTNTPPASPVNGDAHVVGVSPTGLWSGRARAIAYYYQGWGFVVPKTGYFIWVNAENAGYRFDGTAWRRESYDTPEQSYTGTITWTGTAAPSGAATDTYRWSQQGRRIGARIDIVRATAGSAITGATLSWPLDMPLPALPASFQVSNSVLVSGICALQSGVTNPSTNNAKMAIGMDNSNSNPVLVVSAGSTSLRVLSLIFDYWTV